MAIDWTELYLKYKGLWVAIKNDHKTVIASGKTVKEVMQLSIKKGVKQPYLFHVPSKLASHISITKSETTIS